MIGLILAFELLVCELPLKMSEQCANTLIEQTPDLSVFTLEVSKNMPSTKIKTVTTGIAGLDTILGGGIPTGSLIMIVGAPGTGKTILIQQLCFTWASLQRNTPIPDDETAAEATGRAAKALYFSTLSEPHDKLIEHISQFDFFDRDVLNEQIKLLSLTAVMEEGLAQVSSLIIDTVRRERAWLVAVDSFGPLAALAPNNEAIRHFLYRLSGQLSYLGVTLIVSLERSLEGFSPSEGDLTIADGILGMYSRLDGMREYNRVEVRKLRGMNRLRGLHAYRITQAGITFYPRLEALVQQNLTRLPDSVRNDARFGFGMPELEQLMGGGLPPGSSTVVAGSPSVGKTLLSLHFLMEGARKHEVGLYIGFSESRERLIAKAAAFGMDLQAAIDQNLVELLTLSPVELEPDWVATQIRQEVEKRGVQRLVLEGVSDLIRACHLEGRNHNFMAALESYFKSRNITAIYTCETNKIVGSELDLSDTPFMKMAENLMLLKQVEYKTRLHRVLSILKMRDSDYDHTIREFTVQTNSGIVVLEPIQSAEGLLTGQAHTSDEA